MASYISFDVSSEKGMNAICEWLNMRCEGGSFLEFSVSELKCNSDASSEIKDVDRICGTLSYDNVLALHGYLSGILPIMKYMHEHGERGDDRSEVLDQLESIEKAILKLNS